MAGVITTGAHPKALFPGIKAWWGRQYNEWPVEYTDLFDTDTSRQAYEETVEATGFGLAPVKEQGKPISYDSETQGTVTRFTHLAYALGYIVTYEELRDNLYEVVSKRRARALAFSVRQTMEIVGANVYNRGFNASFAGGDGKELFATDHPTKDGTQSNELAVAADLSETALEDLIIQIMGAKNSRGMRIQLMPRSLIVPRQLWFEANRILKSTLQAGTANNDINALRATNALPGGIVVNHYLTDQDAWFIRTNAPEGMTYFSREEASFAMDNDFDTKNAKAASYLRCSFGWSDFRGVFASVGS